MGAWHEDDEFWATLERFLFTEIRTEEMAREEVDRVLELAGPTPGAAILDLGCGIGRHALELARRGFRVTGVDRNAGYLESARERAEQRGLELELVREDMRRFARPGAFELALNMFSTFGYFEDPEEDRQVLRNARRSLAPGGRLLMELAGKEVIARTFESRRWNEISEGGEYLLEEAAVRDGWGAIDSRWTWLRGGEKRTFHLQVRLYSGAELSAALRAAGFAEVKLFGSLAGAPYDHEAERLVALALR